MNILQDTIFALSTPYGKSGIAIIRISGPNALKALKKFTDTKHLKHKCATLVKLYSPQNKKELIDEAMVVYFKSPQSYTGSHVIELNIHGSIAIINELLHELSLLKFLRIAEPGEFTKLALLSNKMSLTQVEGLSDLLNSETLLQKKIALRHYNGQLDNTFSAFKETLVSILSNIEAFIDFPDDDVEYLQSSALSSIKQLISNIHKYIDSYIYRKSLIHGIKIAIIGSVNTGKSTFLNYLAKSEVAIVSDIEGTTRDKVEIKLDVHGIPVIFTDTAGIRKTADPIEIEGIKRAFISAEEAELKILFVDISNACIQLKQIYDKLPSTDKENVIIVLNKFDLHNYNYDVFNINSILDKLKINKKNIFYISLKNDYKVDELETFIYTYIKTNFAVDSCDLVINLRHYDKLNECLIHLKNSVKANKPLELIAEDIRNALNSVGHLLGKIDIEEILDQIFSSFCIGK